MSNPIGASNGIVLPIPYPPSPTYFPSSINTYNAYPTNFPNFRAAMARLVDGFADTRTSSADVPIVYIGDSLTQGAYANSNITTSTANRGNGTRDICGQMSKLFNNTSATTKSTRSNCIGTASTTFDSRITLNGWDITTASPPTYYFPGNSWFFPHDSTALQFAPLESWDTVDVYFLDNGAGNTVTLQAGSSTVSGSLSTHSSASAMGKITYTAPAGNAVQTLKIVNNGSGQSVIAGCDFRIAGTGQIRHINLGSSGSTSANWTDPTQQMYQWLVSMNQPTNVTNGLAIYPALAVICLFYNDASLLTPAQYQANLINMIGACQNGGTTDVCLWNSNNPVTPYAYASNQVDFNNVLQYISNTYNIPLFNSQQRWVSYTLATQSQIGFQNTNNNGHPTGEGYLDLAKFLFDTFNYL